MCVKSFLCLAVACAAVSGYEANSIEQRDGTLTSVDINPHSQGLLPPQDVRRVDGDANRDQQSCSCTQKDGNHSHGGLTEDATIVAMIAFFCFFTLRIVEPDPWTAEEVSEILEKLIQIRSEHSIEDPPAA